MKFGIIFILIGVCILSGLPIIRSIVGFLVILWILKVIFGFTLDFKKDEKYLGIKKSVSGQDYSAYFGKSKIDLSGLKFTAGEVKSVEVNVFASEAEIVLPKNVNVNFDVTSIFVASDIPKEYIKEEPNAPHYNDEIKPTLKIKLNAMVGKVSIKVI